MSGNWRKMQQRAGLDLRAPAGAAVSDAADASVLAPEEHSAVDGVAPRPPAGAAVSGTPVVPIVALKSMLPPPARLRA